MSLSEEKAPLSLWKPLESLYEYVLKGHLFLLGWGGTEWLGTVVLSLDLDTCVNHQWFFVYFFERYLILSSCACVDVLVLWHLHTLKKIFSTTVPHISHFLFMLFPTSSFLISVPNNIFHLRVSVTGGTNREGALCWQVPPNKNAFFKKGETCNRAQFLLLLCILSSWNKYQTF